MNRFFAVSSLSLIMSASAQAVGGTSDKSTSYVDHRVCFMGRSESPSLSFELGFEVKEQTEREGSVFRNVIAIEPFNLPFATVEDKPSSSVAFRKGQRVQVASARETWVGYGRTYEAAWDNLFVGPGEANFPREVISEDGLKQSIYALKIVPFQRRDLTLQIQFGRLDHLGHFEPVYEFQGQCHVTE